MQTAAIEVIPEEIRRNIASSYPQQTPKLQYNFIGSSEMNNMKEIRIRKMEWGQNSGNEKQIE